MNFSKREKEKKRKECDGNVILAERRQQSKDVKLDQDQNCMQCSKITNTRRFKTRTSKSIPLATLIFRELISASGWSSKAHTSMKTNLHLPLVNYANLPLLGLRKRFKFILLVGPPITQVSDHIQRNNFFVQKKTSFRNVSKFTLRENSIFGRTKPGTKGIFIPHFRLIFARRITP